jgi:hypothetical protein
MTDIQILATTAHDYPFGTLHDDQNHAFGRLAANYSRRQIQSAIVKELERMDVIAWNEYITAFELFMAGEYSREAVQQAQDKTYRIRERLTNCKFQLDRMR